MRYTIGKLLGHGQFGYTYVATDKENGDRVAVKRIEKNKVVLFLWFFVNWVIFVLGNLWSLWPHLIIYESGLMGIFLLF